MKKIIFLIILSLNVLGAEQGPLISNESGLGGDRDQIRPQVSMTAPQYIWRRPQEDVNLIIPQIKLGRIGSYHQGRNEENSMENWRIEWSGPSGGNIIFLTNIRGEGEEEGVTARVVPSGYPVTGFRGVMVFSNSLPIDRNKYYYATFYGDLNINIPWSIKIEDGTYRINSRVSELSKIYEIDNILNTITYSNNKSSGDVIVEIRTYLDLNFKNIDFGKVIFTSGSKEIIKKGDIKILGGHNSQINISILESKISLKKVGTEDIVPVFLKLIDGGNTGEKVDIRLDSSGEKRLSYEAKLEPGLYSDITEGKYVGVAKFEIKYN